MSRPREAILVGDKAEQLRVAQELRVPRSRVLTFRQVVAYHRLRGRVLDAVWYTPGLFDMKQHKRALREALPTVASTGGKVLPIEFREGSGNGREQEQ